MKYRILILFFYTTAAFSQPSDLLFPAKFRNIKIQETTTEEFKTLYGKPNSKKFCKDCRSMFYKNGAVFYYYKEIGVTAIFQRTKNDDIYRLVELEFTPESNFIFGKGTKAGITSYKSAIEDLGNPTKNHSSGERIYAGLYCFEDNITLLYLSVDKVTQLLKSIVICEQHLECKTQVTLDQVSDFAADSMAAVMVMRELDPFYGLFTYNSPSSFTNYILKIAPPITDYSEYSFKLEVSYLNNNNYSVEGFAIKKDDTIEYYYLKTKDGNFPLALTVDMKKPLFSLTRVNDLVLTNWGQIQEKENASVLFKK